MKKINFTDQSILLKGVSLSIILNLIIFVLYMVLLNSWSGNTIPLTIIFLTVYILIFQPIKDFLFSLIINRPIFVHSSISNLVEKKAASLTKREEIPDFLLWLCRYLKMPWMRMALYLKDPIVHIVLGKGKKHVTPLDIQDDREFIGFLTAFPWTHKTSQIPPVLRKLLAEYKVQTVTPVLFRDNVIGAIGMPREITEKEKEATEFISRSIALVLENHKLNETIHRNEILKKEFIIAGRVEKFLMRDEPVMFYGYSISRLISSWKKKYFSALYEVVHSEKNNSVFIFLARLSVGSIRANALQLFGVQGYFTAIARGATTALEVTNNLNKALIQHENGKVHLDGFVVQITKNQDISFLGFGKSLGAKHDAWEWIDSEYSLGMAKWKPDSVISLPSVSCLILSIRDFPLVYIIRR